MTRNINRSLPAGRIKAATGVLTAALVLGGCGADPDRTVLMDYRLFTNQPQDSDVPDVELTEDVLTDLDEHYFRKVGEDEAIEFFAARTDHEDDARQGLCLIAVDVDIDDADANCAEPDELDEATVGLYASSLSQPVEAFLVPDETQLEPPEGWDQISDNVVVITDSESAQQEIGGQLPSDSGWEDFTLERLQE